MAWTSLLYNPQSLRVALRGRHLPDPQLCRMARTKVLLWISNLLLPVIKIIDPTYA
jgi:hypothetical protein